MHVLSRAAGMVALVLGVIIGSAVGGGIGAIVGVVLAMMGFQALTLGVHGMRYVSSALATTGGLALIAWRHGLNFTDLGLGHRTWLVGFVWSLVIVIVVGAGIAVAGGSRRTRHLFGDVRISDTTGLIAARRALFDIPFGTLLVEEFAFRGVLLALVTGLYGTVWAVVITSLLFGLWHIAPSLEMHDSHTLTSGSPWPTVISTVIFTGGSGAVFALLRLVSGSLLPPSALHWAANGSGVVVGWFIHRGKHSADDDQI